MEDKTSLGRRYSEPALKSRPYVVQEIKKIDTKLDISSREGLIQESSYSKMKKVKKGNTRS